MYVQISFFTSPLSSSNTIYISNQINNQLRHKIGREREPATQSCPIAMKRVDDTLATHDSLIFTETLTFVD